MKKNNNYTFQEYQKFTQTVAVYPKEPKVMGLLYTALGLGGEAGEFQDKIKKILRDDNGEVSPEKADQLKKELSDCLWYLSQCAVELGFSLEEVALCNVEKLTSRKERGTLQGSGDNR